LKCTSCGSNLPTGAAYCPICSAITPSGIATFGASPHDPTAVSSSNPVPEYHPSTDYGSSPYGVPPQNPYEPLNPYEAPLRPPPPPPPQRQVKIGLLIGAVVLVFTVASASVFALFTQLARNTRPGETTPSPAPTAQTSITDTPIPATSPANVVSIPYPPYRGTLVLDDPLRDNSQGNGWVENAPNSGCMFTGGAYHGRLDKGYYNTCPGGPSFKNFAMEAQITVLKGDCGGIIFRADNAGHHYLFEICPNGGYGVYLYFGPSGNDYKTLQTGNSQAIRTGFRQMNLIAAVAVNQEIRLFVNRQLVYQMTDKSYGMGQCGFAVDSSGAIVGTAAPTEVVFENLKVWTL
jgi:hypothetical protein